MTPRMDLMAKAAELAGLLNRSTPDLASCPHRTHVMEELLAWPTVQQPALAALVSSLASAPNAAAQLAQELADELTATSRTALHAARILRDGAAELTGYQPSDMMVATLRDVHPAGSETDDGGQAWRTYKPGARRVVLALRGDKHLQAAPRSAPYELGAKAYHAYVDSAGGRSLATGDELPAWADLPQAIRDAWAAAGEAVARA